MLHMDSRQSMDTVIELKNVTKKFGSVTVLSDVNLKVERGKTLCIVGPSGCGKTTILNLFAGFITPSSGTVLMNDRKVTEPGPDRSVVFQKDSVFPWLTVRKNLEYGLKMRNLPKNEIDPKVDHYLKKVGLHDCADMYPKELSGGMRKRVDIARAYVNSPEMLLMDEPFGPLDVMTKEVMQKDLIDLSQEENMSLVFITHDIEEAVFLGDRVLVMTARPAQIQANIKIPFKKPREISLKLENEFQQIRKEIDSMLKGGTGK